jgi:hypothetical protein
MEPQRLDALQLRLSVLERRLRAMHVGVFVLIGFVLLGAAVEHAASQAAVIRAREVQLVDSMGRIRIRMVAESYTNKQTFIQLDEPSGRFSVRLTVDPQKNRAYAEFNSSAESATITAAPGNSYVEARGALQTASLSIFKGTPRVDVNNGPGKSSATLDIFRGNPEVTVEDDNGFSSVLGSIDLRTAKTGSIEKRSGASLVLLDRDGNVIWSAP